MTAEMDLAYYQSIEEAFIKPIRSVLIVDDDYPTYEDILYEGETGEEAERRAAKKRRQNPEAIRALIQSFRQRDPALLVDIHDAQDETPLEAERLSSHLHQSDLLILDYELRKNDNGAKAISIIKHLMSNDHFNLVVLHTTRDLGPTFQDILAALLGPCELPDAALIARGEDIINELEDDDHQAGEKFREAIGLQQYLTFRHRSSAGKFKRALPVYGRFMELALEYKLERAQPEEVFYWAIKELQDTQLKFTDTSMSSNLLWANHSDGNVLWLRTDRCFIAFSQKGKHQDLIDELQVALRSWGPSPSRLLSARLRAELDDKGVIAEDINLNRRHVYAKFYQGLLAKTDSRQRSALIEEQVDRHLEDLAHPVKAAVTEAFLALVNSDTSAELLEKYQVNMAADQDEAVKMYNAYVSCKPKVSGWHLEPGHIFELNEEKWLCLSPACDLVPGQKTTGLYQTLGVDKQPFFAVKLHPTSKSLAKIDEAQKIVNGNLLFIRESAQSHAKVHLYDFTSDRKLTIEWQLFIADRQGCLSDDKTVSLRLLREQTSETGPEEGVAPSDSLAYESYDCPIVAQLRYEYALNLMDKFSSNFNRVGLGLIGPSSG